MFLVCNNKDTYMYVYICVHSCYCGMCRLCLRPNCDNFGFVALSFPNDKFVCPEPINSFCGNSDCLAICQFVSLSGNALMFTVHFYDFATVRRSLPQGCVNFFLTATAGKLFIILRTTFFIVLRWKTARRSQ